MEAPGGLLQLGVLLGGQLRRPWRKEMGVGVRLNSGWRLVVDVTLVLLHWQEWAAGLGASDGHSALVGVVTSVGGRSSLGLLGGTVVERLVLGRGWLSAGLRLLALQVALFFPDVVQQNLAVAASPSSSSAPPLRGSRVIPAASVCQRLRAPERPGGVRSPRHGRPVRPHCPLLGPALLLRGGEVVQEAVGAVALTGRPASGVRGGGGVLRAGGRRGRMGGGERGGLGGLTVLSSKMKWRARNGLL